MSDILELILADHFWFRNQFIELDKLKAEQADPADLAAVWAPLGARLDVHAVAEEEIFYPQLLRRGAEDPQEETLDAIGDHNDIRDGVKQADAHPVGSPEWWDGVGAAREANDEHMAEEEREGLADFREQSEPGLRRSMGEQFAEFLAEHRTSDSVDTHDKDPDAYVAAIEDELAAESDTPAASADDPATTPPADGSPRIGSPKE